MKYMNYTRATFIQFIFLCILVHSLIKSIGQSICWCRFSVIQAIIIIRGWIKPAGLAFLLFQEKIVQLPFFKLLQFSTSSPKLIIEKALRTFRKKVCRGQRNTNLLGFFLGKKLQKLIQIKFRRSECESPNEKPRGKKSFDLLSEKNISSELHCTLSSNTEKPASNDVKSKVRLLNCLHGMEKKVKKQNY